MFEGIFTAIVTPFSDDGSLDEAALRRLIQRQVENGVDGIVPCGTTGESPALTHEEYKRVVGITVEECKGKAKVIAGSGANSTAATIEKTLLAKSLGADAALVVTPYYNRPTQIGLFEHYKKVASETKFPIVIYNVPGRTGVNILPETVNRLSYLDYIVSVKEASGSITQSQEILAGCRKGFTVLSGDDALTLPLYSIGGHGVISVASNVAPKEMVELRRIFLKGDIAAAMQLQAKLYPLFKTLFIETNPQPVKAALSILGLCGASPRLPLITAGNSTFDALREILKTLGLKGD